MSPWGPLLRQVLQKFAKSQGRRILTRAATRLAAGAAAAGGAGAAAGAAKAGAAAAASGAAAAGSTAAGTAAAAGGGQILRTGNIFFKKQRKMHNSVATRFPPLLYPVTIPFAAILVYGSQMVEDEPKEVKQVKTVRELRAERQQSNQTDHPK